MIEAHPVRRLGNMDVADYRAIRLATLEIEPAFFGSLHADEMKRPIEDFARAIADAAVLGAYLDSRLVGVVRLQGKTGAKERHKASLHGFFVRPEHRGKGVGSALMNTAIEIARASFEQVLLSVVAGNSNAIKMYERVGFRRYGVEPRARKYDGRYADMVLMALHTGGLS